MCNTFSFLEVADLLGWHDTEVIESVDAGVLPTIYRLSDLLNNPGWPYKKLDNPLISEVQLREFIYSSLNDFRHDFSLPDALATLHYNGIPIWELRKLLYISTDINYDYMEAIMLKHVDNYIKDKDNFYILPTYHIFPDYCNEFVIEDVFRGTLDLGIEHRVVVNSIIEAPNLKIEDATERIQFLLKSQPSYLIDSYKLIDSLNTEFTTLYPDSESLSAITVHDFTGIPYRYARIMEQEGTLTGNSLIEEFKARLAKIHSLHMTLEPR